MFSKKKLILVLEMAVLEHFWWKHSQKTLRVNFIKLFFLKLWILGFRNESCKLFLQEDALIAWKIRLSMTFAQQVQMEWIEASHID